MNASDTEIEEIFASTGPVITFGIHTGKRWCEVPRNYKLWVLTQGMQKKHSELYAALLHDAVDMLTAEIPAADVVARAAATARFDRETEGLC